MKHQLSHPTNYYKYCPHCGSEKFVAISDKEFRCSNCGYDFFTNSAAAVAAIIIDDKNRIMLTCRACEPWKGQLDLPGGFVDPDESLEDALRREIREELNAEILSYKYLCSAANRYLYSGCSIATTDVAFVCKLKEYSNLEANDDINGFEWFAPHEIDLSKIAAPSIRQLVEYYIITTK